MACVVCSSSSSSRQWLRALAALCTVVSLAALLRTLAIDPPFLTWCLRLLLLVASPESLHCLLSLLLLLLLLMFLTILAFSFLPLLLLLCAGPRVTARILMQGVKGKDC